VTRTASPGGECSGDCNGDGVVQVDELVRAVAISLDDEPIGDCRPADGDDDGIVSVDEVIRAVRMALGECPS
jgi:Ca2+-binding EF-hand superfamily protein